MHENEKLSRKGQRWCALNPQGGLVFLWVLNKAMDQQEPKMSVHQGPSHANHQDHLTETIERGNVCQEKIVNLRVIPHESRECSFDDFLSNSSCLCIFTIPFPFPRVLQCDEAPIRIPNLLNWWKRNTMTTFCLFLWVIAVYFCFCT